MTLLVENKYVTEVYSGEQLEQFCLVRNGLAVGWDEAEKEDTQLPCFLKQTTATDRCHSVV